jgi:hypothetical protein
LAERVRSGKALARIADGVFADRAMPRADRTAWLEALTEAAAH